MSIKDKVKQLIEETLNQNNITGIEYSLEVPNNTTYGDYATNLPLKLARPLKKAPKLIAQEFIEKFKKNSDRYEFSELNGFINIKVNDKLLFTEMLGIEKSFGNSNLGKGTKVLIEYVSANPTGPLHIGHGRWAAIGDTLARVLKKCGYQIHREFYVNDIGNQIQNYLRSINAVKNDQPIPEDGYHGHYIKDLAKINNDPVEYMKEHQRQVLKNVGVEFDKWFSEKSLKDELSKILCFLKEKNLTYEKDSAIWFKSSEYGDDKDRVLVKSDGEKTYFLSDIAYHKNKLDRGFTKLINIWGADHHGYVSRVKAAISAIKGIPKDDNTLDVIIGQLVNLFRDGQPVRLSKRTGDIITLEEVAEEIGTDATRYFLARYSTDTTLDFDLTLAKQRSNDNPVYYVQYAHARICSILRQPEVQNIKSSPRFIKLEPTERNLILKLMRFPEELELIANTYAIHRLTAFAEETAKLFHVFYHECRVISDDEQTTVNRLTLIKAVKTVLAIILELLGVSAPEKM
jgi:arginyl-tRNA synthetase